MWENSFRAVKECLSHSCANISRLKLKSAKNLTRIQNNWKIGHIISVWDGIFWFYAFFLKRQSYPLSMMPLLESKVSNHLKFFGRCFTYWSFRRELNSVSKVLTKVKKWTWIYCITAIDSSLCIYPQGIQRETSESKVVLQRNITEDFFKSRAVGVHCCL